MFKYLLFSITLCIFSLFASAQENEVSLQFVSFPISDKSAPIELLVGEALCFSIMNLTISGSELILFGTIFARVMVLKMRGLNHMETETGSKKR